MNLRLPFSDIRFVTFAIFPSSDMGSTAAEDVVPTCGQRKIILSTMISEVLTFEKCTRKITTVIFLRDIRIMPIYIIFSI